MNGASAAVASAEDAPADWGVLSDLPGNPLMWVLIISELLVFGALLLGFGKPTRSTAARFRR